jgi:hypothetical protein
LSTLANNSGKAVSHPEKPGGCSGRIGWEGCLGMNLSCCYGPLHWASLRPISWHNPKGVFPGLRTLSYIFFFILFWKEVSLCSWGWPRTHNLPASASCWLGLQTCTTVSSVILSPWTHF